MHMHMHIHMPTKKKTKKKTHTHPTPTHSSELVTSSKADFTRELEPKLQRLEEQLQQLHASCDALEENSITLKTEPACRDPHDAFLTCIKDPTQSTAGCHELALAYAQCARAVL
jgi:hypothetical protein